MKKRRSKKHTGDKTPPNRRRVNLRVARRTLADLLAANFGPEALIVTLDYSNINAGGPGSRPFRGKCMRNWVSHLRAACRKVGNEARYIYSTPVAGGTVRMILNTAAGTPMLPVWPWGEMCTSPLQEGTSWAALAGWFMETGLTENSERAVPLVRAWTCSKNLRRG